MVRSLGRYGLEVHAAWCPLNSPSAHSRYISKIHRLPEYHGNDNRWLDGLIELMRDTGFDLVLPTHDTAIVLFQSARAQVESAGRVYLLGEKAFEICFSKEKTYELALELGISVPAQRVVRSVAELDALASEWGFPLVVKPQRSVSVWNPWLRHNVQKLWKSDDFLSALSPVDLAAGVLVQKNFIGKGAGVEVLCRNGEILTAFQHERVHEPPMGGGSSYRKSVPLHPELLEATTRLMHAVRYTGVAMVEFKVNGRTGEWILVEINGRFWGSLPLAMAAGMDFPRFLYEMLCLGRIEFPQSFPYNVYCRNWLNDCFWLKGNLRADHTNPALTTVPARDLAAELWNLLRLRERSDEFVTDDPMPAVHEIAQLFAEKLRSAVRLLPLSRGLMRRRAVQAMNRARRVLFLCKGNICRSPFAERMLQTIRPDLQCISAGSYPVTGRRAPDGAVEASRRFNIALEMHRSCILTRELVQAADVVFVFDREHERFVKAWYPEHEQKLHYLGTLNADGPLEIADPYGSEMANFIDTFKRIQCLLNLLRRAI